MNLKLCLHLLLFFPLVFGVSVYSCGLLRRWPRLEEGSDDGSLILFMATAKAGKQGGKGKEEKKRKGKVFLEGKVQNGYG